MNESPEERDERVRQQIEKLRANRKESLPEPKPEKVRDKNRAEVMRFNGKWGIRRKSGKARNEIIGKNKV